MTDVIGNERIRRGNCKAAAHPHCDASRRLTPDENMAMKWQRNNFQGEEGRAQHGCPNILNDGD